MLIDKTITNTDRTIEANNYLLVELDKQGNAKLSNNKLQLKTISETTLVTSKYTFDIANEKLNYGKYDIDFYRTKGEGCPIMPCATQIKVKPNSCIYSDHWRWRPIINIETGRILNWMQGNTASVHYKVCDGFSCSFTDNSGVSILDLDDGYVPSFMCIGQEPDGDYIVMDIDENGYIKDWDPIKVKKFVENLD